ncbi:MAG: PPC domain-containing DNA-binding protein [Candidatus Micrarchaeota archaeon]
MELRRAGSQLIIRLDEGDEIVASLKKACKEQLVHYAYFSGIGACRSAEISHFDTKEKKYHSKKLKGMLEIVSLTGNITTVDNEPLIHAHIALARTDFSVQGGHLVNAEINPTCEIILNPLPIVVGRRFDEKSGLKLQKF